MTYNKEKESIKFTYDYDNNIQGGRIPKEDNTLESSIIAKGTEEVQHKTNAFPQSAATMKMFKEAAAKLGKLPIRPRQLIITKKNKNMKGIKSL